MALTSIGNLTYINQASSATAAIQANNITHPIPINQSLFHEQMQKIEEVRPAEQTHKTEDREGSGKREFDEDKKEGEEGNGEFEASMALAKEKKPKEDREVTEDTMLMKLESHLLDIKG